MKYILVDQKDGDIFTREFATSLDAIETAKSEWNHLTVPERKAREAFYVLESINPDPEADDHFDGTMIWQPEKED